MSLFDFSRDIVVIDPAKQRTRDENPSTRREVRRYLMGEIQARDWSGKIATMTKRYNLDDAAVFGMVEAMDIPGGEEHERVYLDGKEAVVIKEGEATVFQADYRFGRKTQERLYRPLPEIGANCSIETQRHDFVYNDKGLLTRETIIAFAEDKNTMTKINYYDSGKIGTRHHYYDFKKENFTREPTVFEYCDDDTHFAFEQYDGDGNLMSAYSPTYGNISQKECALFADGLHDMGKVRRITRPALLRFIDKYVIR